MHFVSRRAVFTVIFIVTGLLLLTACGSDSAPAASTSAGNMASDAEAILKHSPAGTAQLVWSPTTHALTVKVTLLGLTPGSKHQAHIHTGSCTSAGNMLYPLQDVVADETGTGSSTSTINDVTGGIPATGWYINVHSSSNMDKTLAPISCGNIFNRTNTGAQNIQITLGATPFQNQDVSGNVQMTLAGGALTVTLSLQGLVPKTSYDAHIHSGSCGDQGKVLYNLKPVVANASGKGSTTTTIPGISSVSDAGWYISVHPATDKTMQMDSIACGDVIPNH